MSTTSSMEGRGYGYLLAARANKASGAAVAIGDALQWDRTGTEGLDVKQPVTTGLLRDFAGIAVGDINDGDQKNAALCTYGMVRCKYLNSSTSAKYTYAKPVTGQDYLTYSALPTNIVLLTDQTTGTAVHGPDEGDDAPVVFLSHNIVNNRLRTASVQFPAIETGESIFVVLPEGGLVLGAAAVTQVAITGASPSVITFEIGGTAITDMAITCNTTGAAAGKVYNAVAPSAANLVAAGAAVEVINDGGADTGGDTVVTIWYLPN